MFRKKSIAAVDKTGEIDDLVLCNEQLREKLNRIKLDLAIIQKEKNNISLLLQKIVNCLSANKYNNEKVVLNKVKELVYDYQSHN